MIQDLQTQKICDRGRNCPTHRALYEQAEQASRLRDSTAVLLNADLVELKKTDSIDNIKIQKVSILECSGY